MKEIRIGIIGTGMISHRHMEINKNIKMLSEQLGFKATVAAVSDIDEARLRAWGEQYGIDEKNQYINYREMLKRDDLDMIDVCVHNNLHTPISIEAMKAGFDCYCEKPSAASYRDAKLALDCAKKLGRKYHVQISSLMTYQTRKAKEIIENGGLGDIYYVNLEQCTSRMRPGYDPIPGFPQVNFTTDFYSKRVAGHGPSIDLGVYALGQILFLLDTPTVKSVSGFARQAMEVDRRMISNPDGFGVEDICDGFVKFENGIGFHYLATSANNYKDHSFTYILGSKGGLDIADIDMDGGLYSRPFGTPRIWGNEPSLKYRNGEIGNDTLTDLNCYYNDVIERRINPEILLYNDGQIMCLAYFLGILDENTRYNTPKIALQQLLLTDGIFLSEELGRSVTADEIAELSPSLYLREQEIAGKLIKFDVEF